jgi:hypothetical protein
VDIANLIGEGVRGIIAAGRTALPDGGPDVYFGHDGWQKTTVAVIGGLGAGAIGALAPGLFLLALPVLLSAALSTLTALAILVFRDIVITLLIIASPLAFLAFVLPNTESWFTKWRKAFTALLAVFPVIMAIFFGSVLVANIILVTGGSGGAWYETAFRPIIALIALTIPLFSLPFVLKSAGGILERFGVLANNKQKGLVDRTRNWAKEASKDANRNQRARLTKWGTSRRKALSDENGQPLGNLTARQRAARRLATGATLYGGYPTRRDHKKATQKSEAELIQNEAILKLLDEKDATGQPTARAGSYARRAAGVGGEEGIARLQRAAREQHRKHFVEEVGRMSGDWASDGAFDSGARYTEVDRNGNFVKNADGTLRFHQDHGKAMAAVAKGHNVGFIKAGQEPTTANAMSQMMRGSGNAIAQNAAAKRIADIGDAAAINHALYGDDALSDEQVSGFMQWLGGNAGEVNKKLTHLITKDMGLSGVNGEKMAGWHGTEFKVAASRIRQLREAGDDKAAEAILNAVKNAYTNLATDPNLAKDFNQKHVDAMIDFNNILEGRTGRLRMREYGDSETTNLTGGALVGRAVELDPSGAVSAREFKTSKS